MYLENIFNEKEIRKENIDKNQYTISLLREGFRVGILDKKSLESIQAQIIFILRELIMRYTKGESTSVTNETAEKLLNSVYFSIDAYLLSCCNAEEAIAVLKKKNIKEIYEKGIENVTSCVKEAKVLYEKIAKNKLQVPMEAYNLSIDGIAVFFRKYGVLFEAHNIVADIDYLLVFEDWDARGVFFIKQYLETLDIENDFCKFFDIEEVIQTLINYGRVCRIDYKTSLTNIFEVVINNSIFSVMAGNRADKLTISNYQFEFLNSKLSSLTGEEIDFIVKVAIERVIEELDINQEELIDYINRYKTILVPRIINAVENESLHNIVIAGEETIEENSFIFQEGNRMDDETFRAVLCSIMKCKSTEDKINIISTMVHALEDYLDILSGDCLFGEEFTDLFATLSDMELGLLGKLVFVEELRNGTVCLLSEINSRKAKEEIEWQLQYINFIRGLSKDRIETIESIVNSEF